MIVTAPVAGYSGEVVGVTFADGHAEIPDDSPLLAYFARHGYALAEQVAEAKPETDAAEEHKPNADPEADAEAPAEKAAEVKPRRTRRG